MHTAVGTTWLALMLVSSSGCRTRLWEYSSPSDAFEPISDAATRPLVDASPDLSVSPDLAPIPDMASIPDLEPLLSYCNGIFVLDISSHLYFFNPLKPAFTDIAPIACPNTRGVGATSMAVDKLGTAFINFSSQLDSINFIFKVDTKSGACASTSFKNPGGNFSGFGMGFAANGNGSTDETLFVAAALPSYALGGVDPVTLAITTIGPLPESAELTGTGSGELWAFFGESRPHLARVDKNTAKLSDDVRLPQLDGVAPEAFAFAAFGGDFYIFFAPPGKTTTVYKYHPADGSLVAVLMSDKTISGAGVSTCAPVGLGG